MKDADLFIDEEVPQVDRMLFPKTFKSAYDAVDELVADTPFLQCPTAALARGHLKAWAVDFGVSQLIESGQWKVEGYDWGWFGGNTGRYLRVFTKSSVLTVSQLADKFHQPRDADFRSNGAFDPQTPLFLLPGEKDFVSRKRPHLLLIHGYHKLEFIHVAMPNPDKSPVWFGITNNLLFEIHTVSSGLAPAEGPSEAPVPTIKEQLKKHIRDNGF